jgi:hypothetical protein
MICAAIELSPATTAFGWIVHMSDEKGPRGETHAHVMICNVHDKPGERAQALVLLKTLGSKIRYGGIPIP